MSSIVTIEPGDVLVFTGVNMAAVNRDDFIALIHIFKDKLQIGSIMFFEEEKVNIETATLDQIRTALRETCGIIAAFSRRAVRTSASAFPMAPR